MKEAIKTGMEWNQFGCVLVLNVFYKLISFFNTLLSDTSITNIILFDY